MALPKFANYVSKRTGNPQSVLVGVELEGLGKLFTAMDHYYTGGFTHMGSAMYAELLLVMAEAKRLTPVRYGFLRGSGHVMLPVVTQTNVSVEAGFGGPAGIGNHGGQTNAQAVGYALPVHENLSARHPVGQAKYLEQPFLAALSGLETRLALRVKASLNL